MLVWKGKGAIPRDWEMWDREMWDRGLALSHMFAHRGKWPASTTNSMMFHHQAEKVPMPLNVT
jgi:hypothetical protein